ncbi:retrovirus-related pol polyprotein from transposon TNT 1-94 [Tanacetum coccineum]
MVENTAQIPIATTIALSMFKLDLDPLAYRLLKNREAHIDYLKHTQEQANILRGIVEQDKAKRLLDNALNFACKHAKRIQELLVYVRDTCPNTYKPSEKLVAVIPMNKVKKVRIESVKKCQKQNIWKPMGHMFTEVGHKWKLTGRLFTIVGNSCPLTRITPTKVVHLKETTSNSGETQKPEIKVYSRRPKQVKSVGSSKKAKIVESKIANNSEPTNLWGSNATDVPSSSSLVNDRLSRLFSGKSKKPSHQPKAEDTNQEKLYLLHIDLCGPMRVESINGKKYILVIVDDYSRFTWVKFLRSKDKAPEAIIKCIKNIQVRLNDTIRNIRTYNGTEFVNQTLREFYENVSISH